MKQIRLTKISLLVSLIVILGIIFLIPLPHYNPLWKDVYKYFFPYKTIHLDPLPRYPSSPVIISTKCKSCNSVWDTTCSDNLSCVIPAGYSQGVCVPVLKMGQKYTNSLINKICGTKFSDEINNWKTYTNETLGISFKYPIDINLSERKDSVGLVKDPDFRMIVGACPGFSFSVGKYNQSTNWQYYLPVRQTQFNNQKVDVSEKDDEGCLFRTIFVNQFPSKDIKPRLIIDATYRSMNQDLYDQILSTFKFTN